MTAILLDTHAWAWSFVDNTKLSVAALDAIHRADTVMVSPISFYEIGLKTRLGKWPEMEPYVNDLPAILHGQGGLEAACTAEMCFEAGFQAWSHRDPFDRILAATALISGAALVSRDTAFHQLDDLTVVW